MRAIVSAILLVLPVTLSAEDFCGDLPKSIVRMEEKDFSREAVRTALDELRDSLDSDEEIAEEFIFQRNLVILGGHYRMEAEKWREHPSDNLEARDRFCRFMIEQAFYE